MSQLNAESQSGIRTRTITRDGHRMTAEISTEGFAVRDSAGIVVYRRCHSNAEWQTLRTRLRDEERRWQSFEKHERRIRTARRFVRRVTGRRRRVVRARTARGASLGPPGRPRRSADDEPPPAVATRKAAGS